MPKNVEELAELETMSFDISEDIPEAENFEYVGELPPARQYLTGVLKKMYLYSTRDGVPMLKVLYTTTESDYAGYSVWSNVTLSAECAFLWQPLCKALGITANDLAGQTKVDPLNETKLGWMPVVSIGDCKPENTPVEFAVAYRMHNGITRTDLIKMRAANAS